jgi:hypothetical protein
MGLREEAKDDSRTIFFLKMSSCWKFFRMANIILSGGILSRRRKGHPLSFLILTKGGKKWSGGEK